MIRANLTESANKPKLSSGRTISRTPRSQVAKTALHVTPSKLSPVKLSDRKPSTSPILLTPSSKQCSVCQGIEHMRAINLNDAAQEFTSKLDLYRDLSKSLGEYSSNLDHAIATIKHSIIHLDPKKVEDYFTGIDDKITSVSDNLNDLSNYVTILDSVQETVNSTNTLINSKVGCTNSETFERIDIRLQKLESICSQLNTKLESFDISVLQQYENRLNSIINESTHQSLPTVHNSRTPVNAIP